MERGDNDIIFTLPVFVYDSLCVSLSLIVRFLVGNQISFLELTDRQENYTMAAKPDFIIVPGAWHRPEAFKLTSVLLQQAGYTVHGVPLASFNASPPLQNFDPDVQIIRKIVNKVLSSGKDVVIVYHSYGSVPGSEALVDYLSDLESGKKNEGWGKIKRLVFCCAFILPEGGSLMAALQFKDLPWFVTKVYLSLLLHFHRSGPSNTFERKGG
jgi:hypothetical protein